MRSFLAIMGACALTACQNQVADDPSSTKGNDAGSTRPDANSPATALLPGQWELKFEVVRASAPKVESGLGPITIDQVEVNNPVETSVTCISRELAARPLAPIPNGLLKKGCEPKGLTVADGRIRGAVQCRSPNSVHDYTLDGEYTPTAYRLTTRTHSESTTIEKLAPDLPPTNVRKIQDVEELTTARRIGDCPAG